MYSIKARAIIHAHLSRIPLNPETLEKDRQYIVKKCPYLIQEMITCVNQLILLAYARRGTKKKLSVPPLSKRYLNFGPTCFTFYSNSGEASAYSDDRELHETELHDSPGFLGIQEPVAATASHRGGAHEVLFGEKT